ncbi:hypothetical protein Dacet_1110 [Denitrovibrio acetiphilus DSM 12809]|uniref:Uncharacterized protein n=1 Tax=Denitrovibrio acetiphilus (strain DSM 12809 / NBRC 114555 / N2460) TaxID=522772 RepID=D4H783_DENA2|nr:hypothetical protein [Denitrovibrio acetiphilus]ADD67882.1 hypothetical protein Dacet_1110 [Denitrovibrio acetiphilus DSM 12809]
MSKDKFCKQNKDYELYKASLTAFFQNELEHDKSLLSISIAAIGFYIALFSTSNIKVDNISCIVILIAVSSYAFTILIILLIFYYNKKQILEIISNPTNAKDIEMLDFWDKFKYFPFIFGCLASVIYFLNIMISKIGEA